MDAERNVLSAVLSEPSCYWRVADRVRPEDFSSEGYRGLWRLIAERMGKGRATDSVTLQDAHPELFDLIDGLVDFRPFADYLEDHADSIRQAADVRRLHDAGQRITRLTGEDAFAQAQRLLLACQPTTRDAVKTTRDGLREMVDMLKLRLEARESVRGLSWGVPALDELYMAEPGHLCIIAARPKLGKTTLTMQCAIRAALQGKRGFVASLEMSLRDLTERAVAHLGELPLDWIKHPRNAPEHAFAMIEAGAAKLADLPLLIEATPNLKPEEVIARATQLHMAEPLDFVVIDHMGELSLPGRNETQELGLAAKAFRDNLAKRLDIPVLLVNQLNRDADGREPQAKDLRQSGRLEEIADAVLMLYREFNGHNVGLVKAFLRVCRHSAPGECVMREHLARMRFEGTTDEWTTDRPVEVGGGRTFASRFAGRGQPPQVPGAGRRD